MAAASNQRFSRLLSDFGIVMPHGRGLVPAFGRATSQAGIKDIQMKIAITGAIALIFAATNVHAQGNPSGRGAAVGDPAASSANPTADSTPRGRSTANPSGSGTSTSGGRDDNGDQGRDTMPETAKQPTPQSQQKGLPK